MNLVRFIAIGLVFTFTFACAQNSAQAPNAENEHTQNGKSIEEMRAQSLAELDQTACKGRGGIVRQVGMMGLWRCVTPYSDAGEICSDNSDCEGLCLAEDGVTDYEASLGKVKGLCKSNDSPFGCYAEIRNGSLLGMICVD